LSALKDAYPAARSEVGTVGLLLGCSSNLASPWVADAVIKLLTFSGYRVVVPKAQVCCGAPAINNGDWDTARKLARRNLRTFLSLDVDYITSPDGTCTGALAHDYRELFRRDPDALSDAERLGGMVVDLSRLLAAALENGRLIFGAYPAIVALHDSCHITHTGGGNRWRDLLKAVPNLELREMPNSQHCCGFGGSYAFAHRRTSREIAARKIIWALETGASQLLVGSPGCMLWLASVGRQIKPGAIKVRHAAELMADAL
jgi:Fe-S oxidoreductase